MPLEDDEVAEIGWLLDRAADLLIQARAQIGPVEEVAAPMDAIHEALEYVEEWLEVQQELAQLLDTLRRSLDADDYLTVLMLEAAFRQATDLAAAEGYRVGLMGLSVSDLRPEVPGDAEE